MSVEDPQPTFAVRSVVERGIEKDKFNQLGQGGGVCVCGWYELNTFSYDPYEWLARVVHIRAPNLEEHDQA